MSYDGLMYLTDLENALKGWEIDKQIGYVDYLTYVDYIRDVENDDVLEGLVCCYFGVKTDKGYDLTMFNLDKKFKDLELLLYFNKDGYDVVAKQELGVVSINVNDLLNGVIDKVTGLDKILEIQKVYGKEPSSESIIHDLKEIIRGCIGTIRGKLNVLQKGVPNQLDLTAKILDDQKVDFEKLYRAINLDISKLKTLEELTCIPVLNYHKVIGYQILIALGVVGVNALTEGYVKYTELKRDDSIEKADELLNHYNTILSEYYKTYYPNVASIIPNALFGFICIVAICMAGDYALYNVLKNSL